MQGEVLQGHLVFLRKLWRLPGPLYLGRKGLMEVVTAKHLTNITRLTYQLSWQNLTLLENLNGPAEAINSDPDLANTYVHTVILCIMGLLASVSVCTIRA